MKILPGEEWQKLGGPGQMNGNATAPSNRPEIDAGSIVASFYTDRSVLITGATGFMGKVLVEKLLRSCPTIKNIYILMRGKRGVEPQRRLDELLKAKLFDRIRQTNPTFLNKVVSIQGDITLPGLGISDTDVTRLVNEVSIVFHSAATVKFDEPLKASMDFNVLGTRRVIELCHKIKNLAALIHVSTAYSNCDRTEIDEVFYPTAVEPNQIIEATKWMPDQLMTEITPKLIGDRPNTYTYTKALAEDLLRRECKDLPLAIVRPSIVTAGWKEPIPGWIDNINGPTGMMLASSKGVLRTMLYKSSATADIIPVDTVINLMIVVAWYTATRQPFLRNNNNNEPVATTGSSGNSILIYNCTSGAVNPIKWGEIQEIVYPLLLRYPSADIFRYPGGSFKDSIVLNRLCIVFDHLVPAYLVDGLCMVLGKKRIMVRLYEKLHRAINAFRYFATNHWDFKCNNVLMLYEELQGKDKEIFNFCIKDLHWPSYWDDYMLGARKFVLGEDDSNLPQARRNLQRYYYIKQLTNLLMVYGFWRLIVMRSKSAKRFWIYITTLSMDLLKVTPRMLKA